LIARTSDPKMELSSGQSLLEGSPPPTSRIAHRASRIAHRRQNARPAQ
jgi:hypothetical protein